MRSVATSLLLFLAASSALASPLGGLKPSALKQPVSGLNEALFWEHMGPTHPDQLHNLAQYSATLPSPDHFDKLLRLPEVKAALATIRYAEGADYNRLFGYHSDKSRIFDHMSQEGHPRSAYRAPGGYVSSAAGAYQALPTTWEEEVRKGSMEDRFTPYQQDRFALGRLQFRGLLDEIVAGNTWWINSRAMGHEWASFPASPYDQPKKNRHRLQRYYNKQIEKYSATD